MLLSEYLTSYTILTDAQATAFPFLGIDGRDLVQKIMMLKFGNREMISTDTDIQTAVQTSVNTVTKMHDYNWTKKFATISLVYDPLRATDYTDNTTDTNSGTDTTTVNGSNTGTVSDNGSTTKNDTNTHNARSYDNNVMTETENDKMVNADTNTNTTTNDLHNSSTNALQHGHVLTHNRTVQGRENLTPQEMIKQEREIAEYNFYEMIADEVTDFITQLSFYYDPTDDYNIFN